MTTKVSVIIPCYNAARYVGETLESVRRQTWPDLEVIVVDDGSTDDSVRIIETFAELDVILIRQSNRGQTAALNVGLARATGDFVQYLDADDLIDPDKIAIQMARLADSPGCVASGRRSGAPHSPSHHDSRSTRSHARSECDLRRRARR